MTYVICFYHNNIRRTLSLLCVSQNGNFNQMPFQTNVNIMSAIASFNKCHIVDIILNDTVHRTYTTIPVFLKLRNFENYFHLETIKSLKYFVITDNIKVVGINSYYTYRFSLFFIHV